MNTAYHPARTCVCDHVQLIPHFPEPPPGAVLLRRRRGQRRRSRNICAHSCNIGAQGRLLFYELDEKRVLFACRFVHGSHNGISRNLCLCVQLRAAACHSARGCMRESIGVDVDGMLLEHVSEEVYGIPFASAVRRDVRA